MQAHFSGVGRTHALLQENAVWGVHDKNGIEENRFQHVYMTKWACAAEDKYAYVRTAEMGDFYIIPTAKLTEGTNTERQWFQHSFEKDTTVLHMEWNRGPPDNLLQIPIWSYRVCTHDCKAFCHTINFLNLFQDYQMRHVQHSNLQMQMAKQRKRAPVERTQQLPQMSHQVLQRENQWPSRSGVAFKGGWKMV